MLGNSAPVYLFSKVNVMSIYSSTYGQARPSAFRHFNSASTLLEDRFDIALRGSEVDVID